MTCPASSRKVRVGLVGVGNCASAFVQGLSHYRDASGNEPIAGLMHPELGGYRIGDVEVSAAFDIHAGKVGRDVAEAIHMRPNNTCRFAEVAPLGVTVMRGRTLDGIGRWLTDDVPDSPEPEADIGAVLKQSRTDVLVSYLPVGSQQATEFYAAQALDAGCAFVNCIPVFIASNDNWRRRFAARGVPLIGDDVKSQVGATIVHRVLANLFGERGVRLARTYQLNFGGNADFKNMLERERLDSKKISKTRAVTSQLDVPMAPEDIHIGPSDHVAWLEDRKFAHIRMEGVGFGGTALNVELKLEVWDSPNSAGVVIDAVRCAKLALDRGIGGALEAPSSYFMKSPPVQFTDHEARNRLDRFIAGED
ncbi:inositol-3-phosphate synthase [Rhodoplanes serenus]|jgi:myo-inositol-1-phosphate synthase|uniref:Inositol-3-phosphate synthase n=1 Tax=Rhodoplanes serenus TaxID=200615 RepID=A0A327K7L1_9BRAD|nr:inositol-3-phosphate synthase [Rhodoplanes serenus]MBI5111789.1 inositol-3-phosphate synthase [Rhodovulum sp.]MTW15584.1 inositol-3-phosphate synthase [Rhodoplanes serenus]RAI33655.1 inositol-3-phosphate synthase [Rhodoplanes serenus]